MVEDVTVEGDASTMLLAGPVVYYADPANTADSIEVSIPRVSYFTAPAAACVRWRTNGTIVRAYTCAKTSPYFRTATLEVDRFQGTVFPADLDPDLDPSPGGLPDAVGVASVFERSGIDLQMVLDDTLNDPDSPDVGDNWSEAELHDLMEARFDSFANALQWNLFAVIVPKFGDPDYNSGYYGTMFDWGGWQVGDSFLRQGCAIAEDAIRGREVDALYDTSDKKDRLILQTLIHEIGHAFNLPHAWQRTANPDSGSESFMNYPWGYTDNGGGETNFWSNFRWEFDDVELVWMRHADRNDVIFGGRDWIGSNLSVDLRPGLEQPEGGLHLEVASPEVFDAGVPVQLTLQLENTTSSTVRVVDRLQPEEGMLRVLIERPDGQIVEFVPPVRRLMAPPEPVELGPGASIAASIALTYGAKGYQFAEPGEYRIQIFFPCFPIGFVATAAHRIRVAHPRTRRSEELLHLITGADAAKYLYYGGSRRVGDTVDRLVEATERNAETDPVVVRHIQAALARDAARRFKHVEVKGGRPVVVADEPEPQVAVRRLQAALDPLPDEYGRLSAFDAFTEARLTVELAENQVALGDDAAAGRTLRQRIDDLRDRRVPGAAVERLERRLAALRDGSR